MVGGLKKIIQSEFVKMQMKSIGWKNHWIWLDERQIELDVIGWLEKRNAVSDDEIEILQEITGDAITEFELLQSLDHVGSLVS